MSTSKAFDHRTGGEDGIMRMWYKCVSVVAVNRNPCERDLFGTVIFFFGKIFLSGISNNNSVIQNSFF